MEVLYIQLETHGLSVFGPRELLEFRLECHYKGLPARPLNSKWMNSMHTPDIALAIPYSMSTKWRVPGAILRMILSRVARRVLFECLLVCRQFYPVVRPLLGDDPLRLSYKLVAQCPQFMVDAHLVCMGTPSFACLRDMHTFERRKQEAIKLEEQFIASHFDGRLESLNRALVKLDIKYAKRGNGRIIRYGWRAASNTTDDAVEAYVNMKSTHSLEDLVAIYFPS